MRLVNRAHSPVRGDARGGAPAYSAYDPELQLWVAATLYDTAVVVHEELFGPLRTDEADALYTAYAELGTRLQLPQGRWPDDRAAFTEYWAGMLPRLSVDSEVLALSRELMFARSLPTPLGLAMPLARLVTAGLLPATVRAAYGVRWSAGAERRFRRALAVTGAVWPWLPRPLREWPQRRSLARIRRG